LAATATTYSALVNALVAAAPASLTKTPTTRVFVVEDSELIRGRLLLMLFGMSGIEVVGYAETAADAIAGILAARPDVVVLDIKLKAGSGIEVLRTIKRRMGEAAVIMLTNYATEVYREKCLQAGAEYFLDKTNEFEQLCPIIDQLKRTR
jgi:two-component system, NarL family, response regulator DevR